MLHPRSYAGDIQIDVEVKKFFCKAGVKGMQVRPSWPPTHVGGVGAVPGQRWQ